MPPTPQADPQAAPITYITQHYHHSGHQVNNTLDVQSSAVLEQMGINAAALSPAQLELFKNAREEQRGRLIQLWQIASPVYGRHTHPDVLGNWPQASMETEEADAKYRLRLIEQEKLARNDLAIRNNAEPYILRGYESSVNGKSVEMSYANGASVQDNSSYKQSTDPAYDSREWWHLSEEEPMEHQYGMLQAYAYHIDYSVPGTQQDGDAEMS
jgi:hypothetical protein